MINFCGQGMVMANLFAEVAPVCVGLLCFGSFPGLEATIASLEDLFASGIQTQLTQELSVWVSLKCPIPSQEGNNICPSTGLSGAKRLPQLFTSDIVMHCTVSSSKNKPTRLMKPIQEH